MNLTQRVIVLTGEPKCTENALEVIKDFKANTVIKNLSQPMVRNVFWHNKNAIYVSSRVNMEVIKKYNPVVLRCISGKSQMDKRQLGSEDIIRDFPEMMDHLDIDVGDHKSFDSKDSGAVQKNCFLCKVVDGNPDKEHILYESNHFVVIPGLGAFFDGYVMIIPKRHVMSFAELDKEEYEEFAQVLSDMKFILESVYNKKIFVFECGSGRNGGGKHETSIVHAHMHLAPTDMPVLEEVQKSGLYPAQIEPHELVEKYGEYPYMLYIDQEDNWFITDDQETYFPRQHPRQVLADYMGLAKGEYNWRTNPMRWKLDVIADEIYSFLRKDFYHLPIWIREATKRYL